MSFLKNCECYEDGVPVCETVDYTPTYKSFNFSSQGLKTCSSRPSQTSLSVHWTHAGLLVPVTYADSPIYLRIPREECVKMLDDLLDLNTVRKILGSAIKK